MGACFRSLLRAFVGAEFRRRQAHGILPARWASSCGAGMTHDRAPSRSDGCANLVLIIACQMTRAALLGDVPHGECRDEATQGRWESTIQHLSDIVGMDYGLVDDDGKQDDAEGGPGLAEERTRYGRWTQSEAGRRLARRRCG